MKHIIIKILIVAICCFQTSFDQIQAQGLNLPARGQLLTISKPYMPVMVKGLLIRPKEPFRFDFVVDGGDTGLKGQELKAESLKLAKYFLAALTVPEEEMWVNLSPYEKNRIILKSFGETTMGRDLLAQDYILKQLTASLTYPKEELGKKFWDQVFAQVQAKFPGTQVPVNTFNKVWIMPAEAEVYEHKNGVFVVKSRLKVMLEEDYVALNKNSVGAGPCAGPNCQGQPQGVAPTKEIIKKIILPVLEREINEGAHFAILRQIYQTTILAAWYKIRLKTSILGKICVDTHKTRGIAKDDPKANEKIYQQYLKAFKKGVYNFIKEDRDPQTNATIARKYVSGGATMVNAAMLVRASLDHQNPSMAADVRSHGDMAVVTVSIGNKPDAAALFRNKLTTITDERMQTRSKSFAMISLEDLRQKVERISEISGFITPLVWEYELSLIIKKDGELRKSTALKALLTKNVTNRMIEYGYVGLAEYLVSLRTAITHRYSEEHVYQQQRVEEVMETLISRASYMDMLTWEGHLRTRIKDPAPGAQDIYLENLKLVVSDLEKRVKQRIEVAPLEELMIRVIEINEQLRILDETSDVGQRLIEERGALSKAIENKKKDTVLANLTWAISQLQSAYNRLPERSSLMRPYNEAMDDLRRLLPAYKVHAYVDQRKYRRRLDDLQRRHKIFPLEGEQLKTMNRLNVLIHYLDQRWSDALTHSSTPIGDESPAQIAEGGIDLTKNGGMNKGRPSAISINQAMLSLSLYDPDASAMMGKIVDPKLTDYARIMMQADAGSYIGFGNDSYKYQAVKNAIEEYFKHKLPSMNYIDLLYLEENMMWKNGIGSKSHLILKGYLYTYLEMASYRALITGILDNKIYIRGNISGVADGAFDHTLLEYYKIEKLRHATYMELANYLEDLDDLSQKYYKDARDLGRIDDEFNLVMNLMEERRLHAEHGYYVKSIRQYEEIENRSLAVDQVREALMDMDSRRFDVTGLPILALQGIDNEGDRVADLLGQGLITMKIFEGKTHAERKAMIDSASYYSLARLSLELEGRVSVARGSEYNNKIKGILEKAEENGRYLDMIAWEMYLSAKFKASNSFREKYAQIRGKNSTQLTRISLPQLFSLQKEIVEALWKENDATKRVLLINLLDRVTKDVEQKSLVAFITQVKISDFLKQLARERRERNKLIPSGQGSQRYNDQFENMVARLEHLYNQRSIVKTYLEENLAMIVPGGIDGGIDLTKSGGMKVKINNQGVGMTFDLPKNIERVTADDEIIYPVVEKISMDVNLPGLLGLHSQSVANP